MAASRDNLLNVTISASIAANQTYMLTLDNSESVSISKQGSHFQVSQIETDSKNGLMMYKYIPALNYTGTDEVVLAKTTMMTTQSNSSGCNSNHTSSNENNSSNSTYSSPSYTTVKINISN